MPRQLLESWKRELASWLKANGIEYDSKTWSEDLKRLPQDVRDAYSRHAGSRLDSYLDKGAGSCALRRRDCADHVAAALSHFHGRRLECGDFVVMPNHVHWLVKPADGHALEDLLYSIKRFSATRINCILGRSGQLWQRESYDHIVRDSVELFHYRDYIARNPEAAGLAPSQALLNHAEWRLP